MTATLQMAISEEQHKRSRKSHAKVKTGCITCKIRRKKCDETKPNCLRCTSTGRKCDGYATRKRKSSLLPTPPATPEHKSAPQACSKAFEATSPSNPVARQYQKPPTARDSLNDGHTIPFLRSLPLPLFTNEQEYYCFDFFRFRTGPEFSGYYDSSFWQNSLIRISLFDPTIRSAAIALGAVHRRFELGISPEAFSYCDISMKAYNKALASLRALISRQDAEPAALLTSSMLLAAFEAFQTNYDQAANHILSGLKILFARNLKKRHSVTQPRSITLDEENIREFFGKLETRSQEFFKRPVNISPEPQDGGQLPDIPDQFDDAEHARDVLFTQVRWLMHALDNKNSNNSQQTTVGPSFSYHQHIIRLLQWSSVQGGRLKYSLKSFPPHDCQWASRLLRVYCETAYLLIISHCHLNSHEIVLQDDFIANNQDLIPWPQLFDPEFSIPRSQRHETLTAHFNKLLILSDTLVDPPTYLPLTFPPPLRCSFNFDSGIVNPSVPNFRTSSFLADVPGGHCTTNRYASSTSSNLFTNFRSSKLRHQAAHLLSTPPPESPFADHPPKAPLDWTSYVTGSYGVAEKLTEMEECSVLACGVLPESVKPRWLDVTCFLEDRTILVRYCTDAPTKTDLGENDADVGSLVWTQEWMEF